MIISAKLIPVPFCSRLCYTFIVAFTVDIELQLGSGGLNWLIDVNRGCRHGIAITPASLCPQFCDENMCLIYPF